MDAPRAARREIRPLTPEQARQLLKHVAGHTLEGLLLAQGVDPRTVMETLGHSQISLTLNTYSHVLPALQRRAAARMDEIVRG